MRHCTQWPIGQGTRKGLIVRAGAYTFTFWVLSEKWWINGPADGGAVYPEIDPADIPHGAGTNSSTAPSGPIFFTHPDPWVAPTAIVVIPLRGMVAGRVVQ